MTHHCRPRAVSIDRPCALACHRIVPIAVSVTVTIDGGISQGLELLPVALAWWCTVAYRMDL